MRAIGELTGIQYLRGIAATMVLFFHLQVQLDRLGYAGGWPSGLLGGIDIFYIVSGFIMWSTTIGRPGDGPAAFWRRRIVRIVPLYWIVTLFVVTTMLAAPAVMQSSRFDPAHVVASFLFVGYPHPVTGTIEPVVIPGWTLNHEMFFYLIFGLFLPAPPRIRLFGTVAALAGLVFLGRLMAWPSTGIAGFYTSGMLIEFAIGVLLGALASQGTGLTRVGLAWGWTMLLAGLAGMTLLPGWEALPGVLQRGVPAALLVTGLLVIEAHRGLFRFAFLRRLGDASYSIYLSHMITLSASSQVWRAMGWRCDAAGLCLYVGFAALLAIAAGWLLYLVVERPLDRRLRGAGAMRAQIIRTGAAA